MRDRYKITDKDGIYFVTSVIIEWLPVFTNQSYFDILIRSLEFCRNEKKMKLFAFVILDNHFHLICTAPQLPGVLGSLKKFTAKEILTLLKRDKKSWLLNQFAFYKKKYKKESEYQVWQEGVHPKMNISKEMLMQKIEYIHFNPVRRGLVDAPEQWRYSSAQNYILHDHSLLQMDELPI